jgi:hypothetical protein
MPTKPTTIKITSKTESFEIFALSTSLNEMQMCLKINQLLNIDLQRKSPITITLKKKDIQPLCFSSDDMLRRVTITLIDNKSITPTLDFLKNISFFIKISPVNSESQINEIHQTLASCDDFLFIQRIEVGKTLLNKQQLAIFNSLFQYV